MAQEIRVQPKDPKAARAEIERTRARMSETIDEIEGAILFKKARLKEQLDVGARIREKPLHAAGIVFGIGLVLGFLTGGGDDDEEMEEAWLISEEGRLMAEERAALWEERARRLLSIARAQEDEMEELESAPIEYATLVTPASEWDEEYYDDEDDDEDDDGPSRWVGLRDSVSDRFGEYLSDASERITKEFEKRF